MSQSKIYIADSESRLDCLVSEKSGLSRSNVQKLIERGNVYLNGSKELKSSKKVSVGCEVRYEIPTPKQMSVEKQNIPLEIIYQDDYLAVINKQQGLTVHPAGGNYSNTLVNALLYHINDLSGINGVLRPGIVHRLDKDTSGVMLVAKNDFAHQSLAKQIQSKTCKRIYYALVEGVVKEEEGVINKPLGRSKNDRKKIAIVTGGRDALTYYKVLIRYKNNTLVQFNLATGRTHQIRVHSKSIGHPVVGDKTYGYEKQRFNLQGQLLHSKSIEFDHPKTGERMYFDSQLPDYFQKVIDILERESN